MIVCRRIWSAVFYTNVIQTECATKNTEGTGQGASGGSLDRRVFRRGGYTLSRNLTQTAVHLLYSA